MVADASKRKRSNIPRTIGPYRIDRPLGSGGMGEVYLAYDDRLDRHVAVKRLRQNREKWGSTGGGRERTGRARLRREARALARLSHPSIVPIFDVLELDDGDWLVMEHVDGASVAELLRRSPLALRQALIYGQQVAEGLAAAHAQNIIHRDLKTENVLVAHGRARILDFGLVRNLNLDEDSLTQNGTVLGTVRSMSPEQAQGLPAGPRSDLFSLGVFLQEMLTGRSPFSAMSSAETLQRIVSQAPEPLPPDVPAELIEMIGQLLKKVPELRPVDAGTVAHRLARLAAELDGPEALNRVVQHADPFEETDLSTIVPTNAETPAKGSTTSGRWIRRGLFGILGVLLTVAIVLVRSAPTPSPQNVKPSTTATATTVAALSEEAWATLARYDLGGNTDRAIELFQRLIEADPDSARGHAGLARACYAKFRQDSGDRMWLEQALTVGRHAVELDSQEVEAHVSLGLALVRDGQVEEARHEFNQALVLAPKNADAYRGLGEIALRAGRLDDAENAFRQALNLRPDDHELHTFLGTVYFRTQRLPKAEDAFKQSLRLTPDNVRGYRNLAGVYILQGRLDEAMETLNQGLAIQPNPTLYLNLGTVFFYQGLYTQSAKAYTSALEFPYGANYHVTWGNLGDALRQIPHRQHEAPEIFRQAARLLAAQSNREETDDAWHDSQMALYRAKAGQLSQAVVSLETAAGTTNARSLFRLTVVCEILSERQRALGFLAEALAAGLELEEIQRDPELVALRSDPRYHRLITREAP